MPIHIIRICHSELTDSSGGIACLTTDFHLGRAASYTDFKFPPPTMLMEKWSDWDMFVIFMEFTGYRNK